VQPITVLTEKGRTAKVERTEPIGLPDIEVNTEGLNIWRQMICNIYSKTLKTVVELGITFTEQKAKRKLRIK